MASGVVQTFGGISGGTYSFTLSDGDAPAATVYSPVHLATAQSKDTAIVITFNEDMQVGHCLTQSVVDVLVLKLHGWQAGTGDIVLTPSGGNSANQALTIAVGDATQVSFSGADCTIQPTNALDDRGAKRCAAWCCVVMMAECACVWMQMDSHDGSWCAG